MNACTAEKHGTFTAVKEAKCTCPGPHQERFRAYQDRQAEGRRARHAEGRYDGDHVNAVDFYSPDIPEPTHSATQLERWLHTRPTLPCRQRPEVFHGPTEAGPVGDDLREAQRLCGECLFSDDCLTVAIAQGDGWAFAGGTLPEQRRRIRAQMAGRCAA